MAKLSLISVALAIICVVHGKPPQRIVGGELATEGQIPYIVSLNRRGNHFCGGSIISERHIVTAAHCVADFTASRINAIRLRTGCISTKTGGNVHTIEKIEVHPNYNYSSPATPNDIAIITVKGTFKFDKNTKKIDLTDREPNPDTNVVASGWGLRAAKNRKASTDLYAVKVKIAQPSVCRKAYRSRILDTHVCTIGPVGQGVCMGDSGGPLELDGKLAGIVSFGKPCATGEADVFTSVYHYRNWIQRAMNKS